MNIINGTTKQALLAGALDLNLSNYYQDFELTIKQIMER